MGAPEITRFLTSLAVKGKVAASTQNQALSALLFLYREVRTQRNRQAFVRNVAGTMTTRDEIATWPLDVQQSGAVAALLQRFAYLGVEL